MTFLIYQHRTENIGELIFVNATNNFSIFQKNVRWLSLYQIGYYLQAYVLH